MKVCDASAPKHGGLYTKRYYKNPNTNNSVAEWMRARLRGTGACLNTTAILGILVCVSVDLSLKDQLS